MTRSPRDTDKDRLREALRTARAALDPADRQRQSEALGHAVVEYLTGLPSRQGTAGRRPTVAAYLGVAPEPETVPLLEDLHRLGFGVVVPVCEPAYQLSWATWHPGVALQRSVRAPVEEPTGPRRPFDEVPDVGLILVPALGIDRSGHRIGQGGGYYDRFLAHLPMDAPGAIPRLGVVYRSEVLPAGTIPAESYDQPLAGAFTPDGLVRFGADARPV
ncbi:5-formyltetrahydrofolate cyclo-ligase [Arthrobacter sp. NPDC092385]|uniref:5-formyltetrahydrofolate cyclo-ligase n=1 Tax=Arthrobacter sp. NPDC092385 TaxID=3363943 RepID=UPI00382C341C